MQPAASASTTSSGGTGLTAASASDRWLWTDFTGTSPVQRTYISGEPGTEVGAQVLALGGELDHGLEVVEAVARVVAAPTEDDAVDAAALLDRHARELLQRVRELDLAAAARRRALEDLEDRRVEHVAADDREVAGGVLRGGLLDELGQAHDVVLGRPGVRGDRAV